jgi:tetratricopeptide (TPR) repeat protein
MFIVRSRAFPSASAALALLALIPSTQAQTQHKQASGAIEVTVCDSHHRPLSQASVTLEGKAETQPVTGHTDSEGRYRFFALPDGTYTVHAGLVGYRDRTNDSITVTVTAGHVASVVVLLEAAGASAPGKKAPSSMEYSDEPQFAVAGVTDPTSFGAHGSDAALRTKEALAKDTAALNRSAANGPLPHSPAPAESEPGDVRSAPRAGSATEDERIGKLLLKSGKPRQALPYLDRAAKLDPSDYDASYALALACNETVEFARAENILRALLGRQDRAAAHELLGDVLEHEGRAVQAEREYERAAEMDASEPNFFAWGAELLLYRAYVPASEVFEKGHRLFPNSARMLIGLGVTSYDTGSPEQGVRQLIEASDLDPRDPNPYLFLGKMEDVERSVMPEVLERLKRFVSVQPQNAMAYYYYAAGLEKAQGGSATSDQIEKLLVKSVALDSHLGDAYLQLGIGYDRRRDFTNAVAAYQKAIENTPFPAEAHFRLAQVYRQLGKRQEARREIQRFEEISKQRADETERERRERGQFVYTLRSQSSPLAASKPQ